MTLTKLQLARQVLLMFEKQKHYFASRLPSDLRECKKTEAELKEACREIISQGEVDATQLRFGAKPGLPD